MPSCSLVIYDSTSPFLVVSLLDAPSPLSSTSWPLSLLFSHRQISWNVSTHKVHSLVGIFPLQTHHCHSKWPKAKGTAVGAVPFRQRYYLLTWLSSSCTCSMQVSLCVCRQNISFGETRVPVNIRPRKADTDQPLWVGSGSQVTFGTSVCR